MKYLFSNASLFEIKIENHFKSHDKKKENNAALIKDTFVWMAVENAKNRWVSVRVMEKPVHRCNCAMHIYIH